MCFMSIILHWKGKENGIKYFFKGMEIDTVAAEKKTTA